MSESKMVPREPTQRMLDYGAFAGPAVTVSRARRIWRAMYDAAPTITEPRIGTPERQAWQDAKNREANERMEVIKINEGGAMCSVGPVNITGVAPGSRNGPASESDPPSPDAKMGTHYDGCEQYHHDCALALIARLTAERDALRAENEALRADAEILGARVERAVAYALRDDATGVLAALSGVDAALDAARGK